MVFYAYALAYLEATPERKLVAWVKPHLCACPELLSIVHTHCASLSIRENPWSMDKQTALDVINTDHLFHFMHFAFPLLSLKTNNRLTKKLKVHYISPCSKQKIFCHVRTSDYKHDLHDNNATFRNSDPSVIANALERIFPGDTIYLSSIPSSSVIKKNYIYEDVATSKGRAKQMQDLFQSDILVTPTSGFTLFAHYGPQKLWFYNATCLLASYPLPSRHLISPKCMTPKPKLAELTSNSLATMLLDDWNSLHAYVDFKELTEEELVEEGLLMQRIWNSPTFWESQDIAPFLRSKLNPVGQLASHDPLPVRRVSSRTLRNISKLFDCFS